MSSGQRRGGRRYDNEDRRRRASGDEGSVVKVRGLLYETTARELGDFFGEYKVSVESSGV